MKNVIDAAWSFFMASQKYKAELIKHRRVFYMSLQPSNFKIITVSLYFKYSISSIWIKRHADISLICLISCYISVCVLTAYMYVHKDFRGDKIPWGWNCKCFWTTWCVIEVKHGFSGRALCCLNNWATSPALTLFWNMQVVYE